jgi:hypothetical protein
MHTVGRRLWPEAELRAGDADRQAVVAELQKHFVDGRLTSDELGERVEQALAARTFGELSQTLADLPVIGPQPARQLELARPPRQDLATAWASSTHVLVGALLLTLGMLAMLSPFVMHNLHLGGLPIFPLLFFGFFAFGRPHRGGRHHR